MAGTLVILGGCGGIGRQLVSDAQKDGWTPMILDLAKSIEMHPTTGVEAISVDATDPQDMARAARKLPDRVQGFVNLCGFVSGNEPLANRTPDNWDDVIAGNLSTAFCATREMRSRISSGGAMVLAGSGLGHFARPGYGPYAIAKAGIAAMTRQLALELAPDIRVNCVAPSAVDTAFLRGGTGRSDENAPTRLDISAYGAANPMKRIAIPEDVTGPILFLLSERAKYITGQVLHVNGGAFMP